MKHTLYDVLGLTADATPADIARAYEQRMAAAVARHAGVSEQALLKEAYDILSQQYRRDAYDASLRRPTEAAARLASTSSVDIEQPRRWPIWVVAAMVVGAAFYFWPGSKPAGPTPLTPPKSVVVDRVVVGDAEPRAAAPVAPSDVLPVAEKSSEQLFAQLAQSTAMVIAKRSKGYSQGSAVVIGRGRLITNCHVTQDSEEIQIRIAGEIHDARVGTADKEFDLCILEVSGLEAPAVAIGGVAELRTGQKVLALGSPQGLELTVSEGIISSLRKIDEGTIIQTSAPVSPGSSGGGLFNTKGELVGIVTASKRYGQNLNFAVPADWIGEMRDRARSDGQTNSSASIPNDERRNAGAAQAVSERILGRWHCFRADLGRHIEFDFQPRGVLFGSRLGQPLAGRYEVTETMLTLYDVKTLTLRIDELSGRRMVLSGGDGRLACDRL